MWLKGGALLPQEEAIRGLLRSKCLSAELLKEPG